MSEWLALAQHNILPDSSWAKPHKAPLRCCYNRPIHSLVKMGTQLAFAQVFLALGFREVAFFLGLSMGNTSNHSLPSPLATACR